MRRPSPFVAFVVIAMALLVPQFLAAQPLRLAGLGGPDLTMAELEAGNTVLVVWTSWSRNCSNIVERINELQARWQGKAKVYAVNFNEERAAVEAFLDGKRLTVPVVLDADGSFSKRNAITALPGLVVFQGGRITWAGRLPDAPDELLSGLLSK